MGQYSKKEMEVIENLTSEISSKIFGLHSRATDKIRMIYSKCRSSTEKNKYTDEQIQHLLQEIKNADDNIAVYLGAVNDEDSVYDIDRIIESFLTQEFQEEIEQLATDDFEIEEYNCLPAFYELNSDAEEMVSNFVKGANDIIILNDFQTIKNLVESEYKEAIVSNLRSKINMAIYSKRMWDFDLDENYYSYALSLKSKTPVLLKLQSQNKEEIKKMWREYSPYIITTKDEDFDFENSVDYTKFIWDYLHIEIKNTLNLSLEWDIILNRQNFLTNVPEINTPQAKEKINRFADFVYRLYLRNLFSFLLKLPEITESIEDVLQEINLQFKKIENFTNGIYEEYTFYDFNIPLTKLFFLGAQPENAHIDMAHLTEVYWKLLQQISYFSDKGMYPDHVSESEDFIKMSNSVDLILNNRIKEFIFFDPNKDEEEKPISINDFSLLPNTLSTHNIPSGANPAFEIAGGTSKQRENQNGNEALDNLLESLSHKSPTDKGPFEALNIWNSNLIKFKREVLQTLSKQRAENKKHYLDMVRIELEEKTKNVFVNDELYDSMLSQNGFNRETVFESRDSDDEIIGALVTTPIKLDESMGTEILYFEHQQYIQNTFYNFHYGQTLNKAWVFIDEKLQEVNTVVTASDSNKKAQSKVETFDNILSAEKQTYVLQLLEDLGITANGTATVSDRKKSSLRGIAEALLDTGIFPVIGLEKSYRLIAGKINVELKSKIDFSSTSKSYKAKALKYIQDYPFK